MRFLGRKFCAKQGMALKGMIGADLWANPWSFAPPLNVGIVSSCLKHQSAFWEWYENC
jgi:hypothetical protein